MVQPGAWGPTVRGGGGRRWPRRLGAVVVAMVLSATAAVGAVAVLGLQTITDNIDVVAVGGLDAAEDGQPLHVLVVGSDARDDFSAAERQALSLGDFEGQRSDTVILVTVSADRSSVSLVSMPRDLVVNDTDGGIAKLTETFGDGRDELVRAVKEDLGFPVNHYVEVSITGFMETVEAVGSVRLCLEEELYDRKSGAAFEPGCQELDPAQALSYVRSRQGGLGDLDRISRQQQFLRALVARIVDLKLLLEPARLLAVAEQVSSNITTDDQLEIGRMVNLATDMRGAISEDLEMVTVPGYIQRLDDAGNSKSFIVPYEPGLRALLADIRSGEPLPSRGGTDERHDVALGIWTANREGSGVVESTLVWGGFQPQVLGAGEVDPGATTTVIRLPGFEAQAGWVAAHLGATVVDLPTGITPPEGIEVLVAVGDDAGTRPQG